MDVLEGVKAVDVTGITKGRGFSGAMKRHNFKGQRATHGVKKVHRHMGGTGALAANRGGGRMKKGKKMPGQYGNEQVTIRNIEWSEIDKDNNLLLIHGAVPGPNGGYVMIRETNKVGSVAWSVLATNVCQASSLQQSGARSASTRSTRPQIAPKISQQLLHDVVVMYQANASAWARIKTKDRSEVAGTTKKMYRQKGTGNARAGSRRSPHAPRRRSHRSPCATRLFAIACRRRPCRPPRGWRSPASCKRRTWS